MYGPRYQRMMAERRKDREDREAELRSQEDALLKTLDPEASVDDPNEQAKKDVIQDIAREREAPKTSGGDPLPSTSRTAKMTERQTKIYEDRKKRPKRAKA